MKGKPVVSVVFLPDNQVVQASQEDTLLEAALRADIEISHSCGGNGTCGTCRVWVEHGLESLPPRNEIEEEMAVERGFLPEERLCCQNHPVTGLVLRRPSN